MNLIIKTIACILLATVYTSSIAADITDYESRNECSQIQMDKVIEEKQFKFHYTVANGMLCGRLEVQAAAWIAWAVSRNGQMVPANAVIGLPDDNTVEKYPLTEYATPSPSNQQTLMGTSITQEGTTTIMTFGKKLVEEGEVPIKENGNNHFLFAHGTDNTLGYHGTNRVSVNVNLGSEEDDSDTSEEVFELVKKEVYLRGA